MKKLLLLTLFLLMVVVLAAACGRGDATTGSSADSTAPGAVSDSDTKENTTPASTAPWGPLYPITGEEPDESIPETTPPKTPDDTEAPDDTEKEPEDPDNPTDEPEDPDNPIDEPEDPGTTGGEDDWGSLTPIPPDKSETSEPVLPEEDDEKGWGALIPLKPNV